MSLPGILFPLSSCHYQSSLREFPASAFITDGQYYFILLAVEPAQRWHEHGALLTNGKEQVMKKLFCTVLMIGGVAIGHAFAQDDQPTDSWITIEPRQYKIDDQCNVLSTGDGLTWSESTNNTWRGLDGSWYMIDNKQVYQSLDGFRWMEVPGNVWQDALGNSYTLTEECALVTGNEEGIMEYNEGEEETAPGTTAPENVEPGTSDPESDDNSQPQSRSQSEIEQEQAEYQAKISRRIADLEEEIADLKKDLKDHPENQEEIEEREETQRKLRSSLDKMGQDLDEGWDELKAEIDELF